MTTSVFDVVTIITAVTLCDSVTASRDILLETVPCMPWHLNRICTILQRGGCLDQNAAITFASVCVDHRMMVFLMQFPASCDCLYVSLISG